MKTILTMAFAALTLAACNDNNADKDTVNTTDTTITTTTTTTYIPVEGDVTVREKKVMVMRNGQWVEADSDVSLDNGVVVTRSGRVVKDGQERELQEGEVVNRTGDFFDRSGRAIENAWDATKEGVKDAGQAIEKGAKKVGEKAKDVVDDDDKDTTKH